MIIIIVTVAWYGPAVIILIVTVAWYGSAVIILNVIFVSEDKSMFNMLVKFGPSN